MVLAQLDAKGFDESVYDGCKPCLVMFSKTSCHVCQGVVPLLEELQPKYEGKVWFYYVDVEECRSVFQRFSFLKGVPQILFFKEGEYRGKLSGDVDEDDVEAKITEVMD